MDRDYLQTSATRRSRSSSRRCSSSRRSSAWAKNTPCATPSHKSHAIDSGLPAVHALPGQARLEFANGGDEHGVLKPLDYGGALPLPELGETV